MCHHRSHVSTNTHHCLGWSPEGRSSTECSFRLVGSAQVDRFKNTFSRACLQWGGLTDLVESTELHNSSESPIPVLNAQRWEQRSADCSPKSTLGCRTSGLWLYSIPVVGMLWGARNDQSDMTRYQDLCTMLATWGQLVQGPPFTPSWPPLLWISYT